ncbi:MAG: hypothetical protein WC998_00620 [Candidatus Paceibacterota bacterium]
MLKIEVEKAQTLLLEEREKQWEGWWCRIVTVSTTQVALITDVTKDRIVCAQLKESMTGNPRALFSTMLCDIKSVEPLSLDPLEAAEGEREETK